MVKKKKKKVNFFFIFFLGSIIWKLRHIYIMINPAGQRWKSGEAPVQALQKLNDHQKSTEIIKNGEET